MTIQRALFLLIALVTLFASRSNAQDGTRSIHVTGSGSGFGEPAEILIEGVLSADGESAKDAYSSFAEAKEQFKATFDNMVFPNLKIEYRGVQIIDSFAAMNAEFGLGMVDEGFGEMELASFAAREAVSLKIQGIDKMDATVLRDMVHEILDRAQEESFEMGSEEQNIAAIYGYTTAPVGMVQYRTDAVDAVRELAYRDAMEDCRNRAQTLAKLSDGKLGRVLSVEQIGESSGDVGIDPLALIYGVMDNTTPSTIDELTSDTPGPIRLQVQLKVTFELVE